MEKSKIIRIIVQKIEIREKNLPGIKNFPKKDWEREHIDTFGMYIYCEGKTEAGKQVHFFTETSSIKKYSGAKLYERIDQNPGNFFHLKIGDIIGHEKQIIPIIIPGVKEPSTKTIYPYVEDQSKIIPNFEINDVIVVKYDKSEIKYESNLLSGNLELLPNL